MALAEDLIVVILGSLIAAFMVKLIGRAWEIMSCWRNIAKAIELRLVARDCIFTLQKLQHIVEKEVRVNRERSYLSLLYHRKKVIHGERRIAGLHQYLVDNQPDMVTLQDTVIKHYFSRRVIEMPRLVDGGSPVNLELTVDVYGGFRADKKYSDINSAMRECTRYYWNRLHLLLPRFIRRIPYLKSALDDIKTKYL